MPVFVDSVKIYSELSNQPVDWLLANVGDKIRIEIELNVKTFALASTGNPIYLNMKDGYVGNGWVVSTNGAFADFKVGDTVNFGNYVLNENWQTLTVIEKLSDDEIRFDAVLVDNSIPTPLPIADNYESGQAFFSITNPITALKYRWNFIENNDQPTFASKVDGTEHQLLIKTISAASPTVLDMEFLGAKPYQIGNATIEGAGIDTPTIIYTSRFKIIHYTYITPFLLAAQWEDLTNNIAPDYFFNNKALKAIFDFEAYYNYNDPNRIQSEEITEIIGNSGWLNENFNTGITNYSITSVVYKRPDTSVISAVELTTNETSVEIIVKNNTDTPFSNTNTKFVLNFIKAPFDASEYQANGKTMDANFLFDRALQTVGVAPVNGDQFGVLGRQVLKSVESTFISTSELLVKCKIAMDADVLSVISESDERRYLLWLTIQNHTLATNQADKVSLKIDADNFFEDTSDPGLIINSLKYLRHPESDILTEGLTALDVFPEDEIVAYSQFYIDKNGRLTDDIQIKSIQARVKAKNSSNASEFTLDNFNLSFSGLPFINGNQYVSFELDRVFHIPSTEIRKKIQVKRRTDLDGGNKFYYDIIFPFLMRWEYWKALADANGDFFNITEPQNGWNQFWHRYSTVTNWGIYYELKVRALKNGELLTYTFENQLTSNDYDTNPAWEPDSIKAYDPDTNTLLYDGVSLRNFILGYKNTRIEALFTKNTFTPNISKIHVNFGIEVFEEGGIEGRRRISSKWPIDSDTWWLSIDGTNKTKLTLVGNTVKAEALVDFSKIPLDKQKFKLTARLYDLDDPCGPNGKKTEDGLCKLTEDGIVKQLE